MGKEKSMYTYNMMVFTLKKGEILQYVKIQMNLDDIMINEMSHTEKHKYYMLSLILWNLKKYIKGDFIKTEIG